MPFVTLNTKDGPVTAHVCIRGSREKKCRHCTRPSTRLCDFPVGVGKTCDIPICDACATPVGPDRDYCLIHKGKTPPAEQAALFPEVA